MNDITDILGETREGAPYATETDAIRAGELDFYLCRTTKWLSDESKQIARGELAEHYQMAYSRHRAGGAAEYEAHDRALWDLGNPRRLNRQFRARLLTRNDQAVLDGAMLLAESGVLSPKGRFLYRAAFLSLWLLLLVVYFSPWLWCCGLVAYVGYCHYSVRLQIWLATAGKKVVALRTAALFSVLDASGMFTYQIVCMQLTEMDAPTRVLDGLFAAILVVAAAWSVVATERIVGKVSRMRTA
ncbi:MAG: hypothetical protein GC168_02705 [Candidatus Hydrogenedens sp.]|nr:hypothetical protein [Candidatus Hydrogenedens sp.]